MLLTSTFNIKVMCIKIQSIQEGILFCLHILIKWKRMNVMLIHGVFKVVNYICITISEIALQMRVLLNIFFVTFKHFWLRDYGEQSTLQFLGIICCWKRFCSNSLAILSVCYVTRSCGNHMLIKPNAIQV